jgi:uncharacterized membrane protein YozB (DUF420 family)
MSDAFLVMAILSVLAGVVAAIRMTVALNRRGIHVNLLLWRVFFFRYLHQYKRVTVSESGKVGPLYYSYVTAMVVAVVCAIIGLILRAT